MLHCVDNERSGQSLDHIIKIEFGVKAFLIDQIYYDRI